ncbi:MAG: glycosyl hydrolase [Mediterranea massiliensis]|nr:glycosyl hydrolase [Mediterranea massiliensis]
MDKKKRLIAIHLPQFHPFKENDEWWGKGFTEWTNVAKARPRFRGHYQPHIPADLGFYDLRLPEVREEQAKLAKEYGIYGFCYYHYWFDGKVLMEKPLKEILERKHPNFPFMICWANENWTRAWDGSEKEILISQNYSDDDARNHIKYLIPYLKDSRYIKVYGKPIICIYRTSIIPNIESMLSIWRDEAIKEGIELYIVRFESCNDFGESFLIDNLDAAVEFQPHNTKDFLKQNNNFRRVINAITRRCFKCNLFPNVIDYHKYVEYQKELPTPTYKIYPSVTPRWDNSPRRKNNYFAFVNSKPEYYGKWLRNVLSKFVPYSDEENFVFINAWNEWAEGNHLEPDLKYGKQYLQETKYAIEHYVNEK